MLGSKSRHAGFSKADRAESTAEATSSCVAEGTRAIGRLVAGSKTLEDALEAEGTEAPPMKRPYSCSTTCAPGRSIERVDNKRVVNGLSQTLTPPRCSRDVLAVSRAAGAGVPSPLGMAISSKMLPCPIVIASGIFRPA